MSNSSNYPKPYVFWKWRNGGVNSSYIVDKSPLILPVTKSVIRDEENNNMCSSDNISFSRLSNKREDTCTKMGEREMMRQVGMNPFLQTDYVKGIEIRDKFLVPYHESKPSYSQSQTS